MKNKIALALAVSLVAAFSFFAFAEDRIGEVQRVTLTVADSIEKAVKVVNDTHNRFTQYASGKMEWGSGSATPDVVLERTGSGVLALSTGAFKANIPVVNATASTLAVTSATHSGALVTLNRAAGIAVTLPAATGSGSILRFVIGTTVTSNSTTIVVADASDIMTGVAIQAADAGSTSNIFETAATDDTITFNGTTTGGIKGDYVELIDVAADTWYVRVTGSATGTEATPFSATI